MNWRKNTQTMHISPKEVEFSDRSYYLPSYEDMDALVASISEVGILNPPVVKESNRGKLIPVLGRRRMKAVIEAGIEGISVLKIGNELPEKNILSLVFWDNFHRIKGNPVATAVMTDRLLSVHEPEVIAQTYLHWMGVPPRGPKISRLRTLASLDESCLRALSSGKIIEKTAILLARLTKEERSILLGFIQIHGWNANKSADALQAIFDLSLIVNKPVNQIVREASEIIDSQSESSDESQRSEMMRNLIRSWKYKDLVEQELLFDKWLEKLQAPCNTRIKTAQSFESEALTLEIKAASKREAEAILKKLNS